MFAHLSGSIRWLATRASSKSGLTLLAALASTASAASAMALCIAPTSAASPSSQAVLAQAPPPQPNIFISYLIPLGLIFIIFYVLIILPQRRRQKAHEEMLASLGSGEKVITNGGILGTIVKVEKETLRLKLAPQVEVTVLRSHIAGKAGDDLA